MPRALILVALVVAALSALWWSTLRGDAQTLSGMIECDEIRLGSRVGGRVQEALADEGQRVSAGQALLRLEPYDLHERLAEAQAALAARAARLSELKSGFRAEEITQARARRDAIQARLDELLAGLRPLELQIRQQRVAEATAEMQWAETEHARIVRLYEQKQASKEELDSAVLRLETTRAQLAVAASELALGEEGTRAEQVAAMRFNLAEASANLALLENGYRSEQIEQAEAEAAAAEAAVGAMRRQVSELEIVAPVDGVVDALELEPGDLIPANTPMITVLATSELWIRAYVPENRIDLKEGQALRFEADAIPGAEFTGRVSFISRRSEFMPSNVQTPEERIKQVYRIRIRIESPDPRLRPGMAVDVHLEPRP